MSGLFGETKEKKEVLKELIKQLHEGTSLEVVKERFHEVIKATMPDEIAQIEEELIKEGMPREDVQKLCDIHLAVFREALEDAKPLAPAGHPIYILVEEHKMLLKFAEDLRNVTKEMQGAENVNSVREQTNRVNSLVEHFKASESHYLREENVLFPYLEKYGITQPPKIMWMEHDQIRTIEKNLYTLFETHESMDFQDFAKKIDELALSLAEMLSSHFYKETNILFPTSLKVIGNEEWTTIRQQFDEIGYCCFTPELPERPIEAVKVSPSNPEVEGMVPFETGALSTEVIEAIFNTLPVDITFVDKDDAVRYFSQAKERIFVRTKAIIGRKVQQCHPQKSIHIVNHIVDDFKSGKRDVAEFWINVNDRFIYIRYFPVRNKNGEYLGSLEVSQDITDLRKLEGEKRLL